MGLMYLSRIYLDILFAVVYSAPRCNNPTENDLTKAEYDIKMILCIHYAKHA